MAQVDKLFNKKNVGAGARNRAAKLDASGSCHGPASAWAIQNDGKSQFGGGGGAEIGGRCHVVVEIKANPYSGPSAN